MLSLKKSVGLEIDEESVKKLKSEGYSVLQGDAQNFDINQKFDVLVAGELIEHLDNQAYFSRPVRNI